MERRDWTEYIMLMLWVKDMLLDRTRKYVTIWTSLYQWSREKVTVTA